MTTGAAAAIYARISSDQDGMGLGVARQVKECRALAQSRGWTVVEEFVDNDISAYSGKVRPEYERMLAAMVEGRVDAVIVYHLDRLTRRPKELEEFVDICDRAGIKNLATVSGDVNIGSGDGLLIARIQAAVAANESASKSRRMRSKWQQVAESGRPHSGASRAFGYEADGVTVNHAEAELIRQCAARVLAGETMRSVASWLDRSGVPTVRGGLWRGVLVRQMLTNPRMVGLRSHNGEIVGKAEWAPILTEDEQARIITLLDARRASGKRAPLRYLLSGMVRCGRCHKPMVSAIRHETRRYRCISGPDHYGCGRTTVVAPPLEALVTDAVLYRLDTPQLATLMAGDNGGSGMTVLRDALAADEAQLIDLSRMWAERQLNSMEWKTARDVIEARVNLARRQIAEKSNTSALLDLVGTGEALRVSWSSLNLDRQAAIIRAVVDHVVITPGVRGARVLDPDRVQPVWLF